MWHMLTGRHREITISFLPVGHKSLFQTGVLGCSNSDFVEQKSTILITSPVLLGHRLWLLFLNWMGTLDGQCFVLTYGWGDHFDEHNVKMTLKGINHFRFTSSSPGAVLVFVKKSSGENEKEINLLKDPSWWPTCSKVPDLIILPGLSLERQCYLYEKIREFCSDSKDLVCPKPPHPLK